MDMQTDTAMLNGALESLNLRLARMGKKAALVGLVGGWDIGVDGKSLLGESVTPLSAAEAMAWMAGFMGGVNYGLGLGDHENN